MKRAGLYIHIPFCVKKCIYCDFNSYPGCPAEVQSGYFDALEAEIRAFYDELAEELCFGGEGWKCEPSGDCAECEDGGEGWKCEPSGDCAECEDGGGSENNEDVGETGKCEDVSENGNSEDGGGSVEYVFADTLFIGGGTPSAVDTALIEHIMETVRRKKYFAESKFKCVKLLSDDAEVTIEINPGTVTSDALLRYKKAGINRISIGVQSMNDKELEFLGRIHSADEAKRCFKMARDAGFENINIDLIFGFPGMSIESWKKTLEIVIDMHPEHISFYSLQIEEGTPLYSMFRNGEINQISEEADREMYHLAEQMLESAGYVHYEISNAALPGKECRHNIKYWNMSSYVGFGVSAHSYVNGRRTPYLSRILNNKIDNAALEDDAAALRKDGAASEDDAAALRSGDATQSFRYYNEDEIDLYINRLTGHKFKTGREYNPQNVSYNMPSDELTDAIFTGLRLAEGLDFGLLERTFGKKLCYKLENEIKKLLGERLMNEQNGRLRLTHNGRDLSNYVIGRLINCVESED